jgi:hypothetical protein
MHARRASREGFRLGDGDKRAQLSDIHSRYDISNGDGLDKIF